MSWKLLLERVSLWTGEEFSPPVDVLIDGGTIVEIGSDLTGKDARVIDATGCLALPGLVDLHTHVGEPGREDRETIESALAAASSGGFTHIVAVPDQPLYDQEATIGYVRDQAARLGGPALHVAAALTKGREGKELADVTLLKAQGAVAFADASPVTDAAVLRRALEYTRMLDTPVWIEARDASLSAEGSVNESEVSTWLGLIGIPPAAEWIGCNRALLMVEAFGGKLHLQGISTAKAATMIADAKARGVAVTAECSYLHLILSESAIEGYDAAAKVSPPLRSQPDVEALIDRVRDGTIDCIVTDHTPRTREESDVDFEQAPFGAAGLETALPALYTHLIRPGKLDWKTLLRSMSERPRHLIGLPLSRLEVGQPADLTVFDPDAQWTVDVNRWCSKAKNNPFDGHTLIGRVRGAIRNHWVSGPMKEEMTS